MKPEDDQAIRLKAQALWAEFTPSEKTGCRFGMFPAAKMQAVVAEGYDGRLLAVALMERAALASQLQEGR